MLYYLLTSLYVFVCFVLLMVILLQQGKGGDMASAFGGGSSQTAFGARGGATLLTKMTTVFAVLFMLGALALAIIGQRGPSSIVGGTAAPPASSAPKAPATPAAQQPASAPAQQPATAPAAPAQPPTAPKF
jgi:preprotein translocase subunit SecG